MSPYSFSLMILSLNLFVRKACCYFFFTCPYSMHTFCFLFPHKSTMGNCGSTASVNENAQNTTSAETKAPETKAQTSTAVTEVKTTVEETSNRHIALSPVALKQLFHDARTHHSWTNRPVAPELLQTLYDLVKMAPTAYNCSPGRFVFLTTPESKEKLVPCLMEGNIPQVREAPVTIICAYDEDFCNKFDVLSPGFDAASIFHENPEWIVPTALLNGSLMGAYTILAARSLGLDCGPMSGFSTEAVDEAFFGGTSWKSNFLINIGYGYNTVAEQEEHGMWPRAPRLDFKDACHVL